jgi:hypothetical protein
VFLYLQKADSERVADVISRRSETITGRVDQRHNRYWGLAFGSLMAAGASIKACFHAKEVSNFGVFSITGSRLHLRHHELVLRSNSSHFSFLFLFRDNIILNFRQVDSKIVFKVFNTRSRSCACRFSVSVSLSE